MKEAKKPIGARMKENYEDRYRIKLTRRTPAIMRLDGRAFHTLTRSCEKPFDNEFIDTMNRVAQLLMAEVQGAKCSYIQSDEISLLQTDFDDLNTEGWFDYNVQKICSIAAAIASVEFTQLWRRKAAYKTETFLGTCIFDCRTFNIPKEEVCNYFVWRQQDWERNSLQMLAQAHYSHKELLNKGKAEIHDMLHLKGINWAELTLGQKNGWFVFDAGSQLMEAPIFAENRMAIEQYLVPACELNAKGG